VKNENRFESRTGQIHGANGVLFLVGSYQSSFLNLATGIFNCSRYFATVRRVNQDQKQILMHHLFQAFFLLVLFQVYLLIAFGDLLDEFVGNQLWIF